jgi:peptidoglycan/LPS O-acetylase OafA/YrhL
MTSNAPRLIFANQLRGLAALSVAASHLVGVFWILRDTVSAATMTPAPTGPSPDFVGFFAKTYLNFGPLGVGAFFLISGLVIPMSLDKHTRASFLLARLLRIYPTYIAALLIEMAALRANAAFWGQPFPYTPWMIVSNALLIYNTVGLPSLDLVNWTLCVELKFYLLMMLLAPRIRAGSTLTVLGAGLCVFVATLALDWAPIATRIARPDLADAFSTEAVFLIFMLIGVLFNFHLRGLLRLSGLAAGVAVLTAMFIACWLHSAIRAQVPIVTANYLYDIAIFAGLYFLRRKARPIRLLDFFAAISFPFYLFHSLIGFSVLRLLMTRWHIAYLPALAGALAAVICLASILHFTVELKTIAWGKRLARRQVGPRLPQIMRPRAPAI